MIITSQKVIRSLIFLVCLGIFVRGLWLSQHLPLSNWFNVINYILVVLVLLFALLIVGGFLLQYLWEQVIVPIWNGEKELFKPFNINLFKKKK